jgi:hypothetical protein
MRTLLACLVAAFPAAAHPQSACPFLTPAQAAPMIGESPIANRVNVIPVPAGTQVGGLEGAVKATSCSFSGKDDPMYGGLTVRVIEYSTPAFAKKRYDDDADESSVDPVQGLGDGAVQSRSPLETTLIVLKGKYLLWMTNRWSPVAKRLLAEDPDGSIPSLASLAPTVIGRLGR